MSENLFWIVPVSIYVITLCVVVLVEFSGFSVASAGSAAVARRSIAKEFTRTGSNLSMIAATLLFAALATNFKETRLGQREGAEFLAVGGLVVIIVVFGFSYAFFRYFETRQHHGFRPSRRHWLLTRHAWTWLGGWFISQALGIVPLALVISELERVVK